MQTSRGVDDHVIGVPRGRRLQRVVEHGRRISARLGANHFGAGALSPDFKLLDGCGAESIGRAKQNCLAVGTKDLRQLADGRGLARAVYADHQNDFRRAIHSWLPAA